MDNKKKAKDLVKKEVAELEVEELHEEDLEDVAGGGTTINIFCSVD